MKEITRLSRLAILPTLLVAIAFFAFGFLDVRAEESGAVRAAEKTGPSQSDPRTLIEKTKKLLRMKAEEKKRLLESVDVQKTSREVREAATEALDAAQTAKERIEERVEKNTPRAEDLKKKFEEKKERLADAVQNRIEKYLSNMRRKMDAALERLDELAVRIDSRIVKLEARGLDMTEAKSGTAAAREEIGQARKDLEEAFEAARETLQSDTPQESFGKAVSALAHAKENLRDAHNALIEVVQTMKKSAEETEDTEAAQ